MVEAKTAKGGGHVMMGVEAGIIQKLFLGEVQAVLVVFDKKEYHRLADEPVVDKLHEVQQENERLKELIERINNRAINGRPNDLGMGTKQAQMLAEIEDLITDVTESPKAGTPALKEGESNTLTQERADFIREVNNRDLPQESNAPVPVQGERPKYYTDEELRDIISMVCDQLNEGFNGREEFIDQTIEVFAGRKAAIEELRKQGVKHPNPHLCDNKTNCGYPGCECLPF
jgi:hypothetical protein